jgi:hypothetical protein
LIRIVVSVALVLTAASSVEARPSTLSMSCHQAQRMVASHGAVVMTTGPHTYDRFVANPGFCEVAEWAHSATAPTKDAADCPMGYICNTAPPLWYDHDGDGLFIH